MIDALLHFCPDFINYRNFRHISSFLSRMNRELESLRRIHQTATSFSAFFKQDVVFEMNVLVKVSP